MKYWEIIERSGLQTRIPATESISLCADEMLTAFLELERVARESLRFQNAE
jgi:hypothetical protein